MNVRRVEKPWGFELIWAHTEKYVGKLLHVSLPTNTQIHLFATAVNS